MHDHGIDYFLHQLAGRDVAFGGFAAGAESALVVIPTGTGNTGTACIMAEQAIEKQIRTPSITTARSTPSWPRR